MISSGLSQSLNGLVRRLGGTSFVEDRRGGVVVLTAAAPIVFGFAALAIDVSLWRAEKLRLQTAVDAAAIAAAHAQRDGADAGGTQGVVARELARNGFDPQVPGNGFQVTMLRGATEADLDDVEVTAHTASTLHFARLFLDEAPVIEATSLSGYDPGNYGRICVLALDESAPATIEFSGTPYVDVNCSIASNSNDPVASIDIAGSSSISAAALIAHGGIRGVDGADVTAGAIWAHAPAAIDPFGPRGRDLQVPLNNGCDVDRQLKINQDETLQPGRYCGGIRINSATVTFAPGLYVIDGGEFRTAGQSRLVGDGVTFVLTGASPSLVATMDFAGGTHLDLRAPDKNDAWARNLGYEGVLFFQDPQARRSTAGTIDNKLLGGSIARLEGAVYFPQQTLLYTGGANLTDSCLMLVARQVIFRGNARFVQTGPACEALGVEELRLPGVRLLS